MHHNSTKVSKLYIKGKKEMETRSNKVIAAMAVDKEGRNDASPSEQASKQASKPAKCVAHNYSASQRSVTHTHTHTHHVSSPTHNHLVSNFGGQRESSKHATIRGGAAAAASIPQQHGDSIPRRTINNEPSIHSCNVNSELAEKINK